MAGESEDDLFLFSEEEHSQLSEPSKNWKILTVDDDANYQRSLLFSLRNAQVQGLPIEILTANSAAAAAPILVEHPDISVILLDVVMEEDDSGLKLINSIRNMLGNKIVRIILLTGQPGIAPRAEVMKSYDIDEYWNKSELTGELLQSILNSHIRTWDSMRQLEEASKGLQLIVDACRTLSNKRDLFTFTQTVLQEINSIIGIKEGGLIVVTNPISETESNPQETCRVVASSGIYSRYAGFELTEIDDEFINTLLKKALAEKQHQFEECYSVFYFETKEVDKRDYLVIAKGHARLTDYHIFLLQVFSENIRTGFTNVALFNRLTELAYYDREIKSFNRNWLIKELNTMTHYERENSSLLLVAIEKYGEINLTFGSQYINRLLKNLYHQLKMLMPNSFVIARARQHIFAIVVESNSDEYNKLPLLYQNAVKLEKAEHFVDLTIADLPLKELSNLSSENILRTGESMVEKAMLEGNNYILYDQALSDGITRRYRLLQELKKALTQDQFYVVLQPKVNLVTSACIGYEALVRWKKSSGEFIPPDQFIPLAEAAHLIGALDILVFKKTLEAVKALQQANIYLPISFNATSRDLQDPVYITSFVKELELSEVLPEFLEMEITESQAMENYEEILPQLQFLTKQGIRITIDDFGTGYSSLAHITNLNANGLKIDRSFVMKLGQNSVPEHVISMILNLGHFLEMDVIAEGIETEEHRQTLIQHGCQYGQGYLFAKPLPVSEAISWTHARENLMRE